MAYLLGVDTGGTYTDAVVMDGDRAVLASAKSLTTRNDLSLGVGRAIDAVLNEAGIKGDDVAMVSLSTTLATNALVEGQGGRVGLIFIGFGERDVARQGLDEALKGDPVVRLIGGHNHAGGEVAPLDVDALHVALAEMGESVSSFAVAAQFGVRNPAHERAARDIIRDVTGRPVTCSHELSAKLGGPKRAMTALLNARLIGMIDHLIGAVEGLLVERAVSAPLMVVRGDGALISADQAREKPIETILSGPAASIVGARWLTDVSDALVSDIGGTTTDIALLRNGRPTIDPDGASVGGFRTMVEAVAMRTFGLGGDSQVHMAKDGLAGDLVLGPRRVLPVSLIAKDWPDVVHKALDAQLTTERAGEFDGRFVVAVNQANRRLDGLSDRTLRVLERIGDQAHPLADIVTNRMELQSIDQLVTGGLVQVAGLTPSDASHVLGLQGQWDKDAAEKALTLFGRQRTGSGDRLCSDATQMATRVIDRLTQQTVDVLLECAFAEEGEDFTRDAARMARHFLIRQGLNHHRNILSMDAGLNMPVIGLGASAKSYYGAVGAQLSCDVILPEHGGVANAIGAVVGQVVFREMIQITSAGEGQYRVHFIDAPKTFTDEAEAFKAAEDHLKAVAQDKARTAGAVDIRCRVSSDVKRASVEGRDVFVEATLNVSASGRPGVVQ